MKHLAYYVHILYLKVKFFSLLSWNHDIQQLEQEKFLEQSHLPPAEEHLKLTLESWRAAASQVFDVLLCFWSPHMALHITHGMDPNDVNSSQHLPLSSECCPACSQMVPLVAHKFLIDSSVHGHHTRNYLHRAPVQVHAPTSQSSSCSM